MAAPDASSLVARALALRQSHPQAPALDVLDLVFQGLQPEAVRFPAPATQDDPLTGPRSPFGALIAEAFDRVMSHDATTFGGASGSLMFAWKDKGTPGYGLHFSGAALSANYALSLQRAADALKAIGVPLV